MRLRRYVLDTNVCLHVLNGDLAMPLPSGSHIVSAVTEIELFSKPGLTIAEQVDLRAFLAALPTVELPENVREEAARIRRDHGLKLPDAIIAATAITLGADLLSNDRQMARVPGPRGHRARAQAVGAASGPAAAFGR